MEAYQCPNCGEFVFTEEQIEQIERRTEAIKGKKTRLTPLDDKSFLVQVK